jgi:hypothetical protein
VRANAVQGSWSSFGTVFKIDTADNETVLHSLAGRRKGFIPQAGSFEDQEGDLFGTTYYGGPQGSSCRTVFSLNP